MLRPHFRIVNFRSFLCICAVLFATVFCSVVAASYRVTGIVCYTVFYCFLIAAVVLLRKRPRFVRVTLLMAAVLSACVFTYSFATMMNWHVTLDYDVEHSVHAEVASVRMDEDTAIVLDDVVVDGVRHKGSLKLYVYDGENATLEFARPGDQLYFRCKLRPHAIVDGLRVDAAAYRSNVRMIASMHADNVTHIFGEQSFRQRLKTNLYQTLVAQIGKDYADIAYGMLTGDKYLLSSEIQTTFSISGIGHILAVSGLHIGFLCALLLFLLKRTRPLVRMGMTSAVLLMYLAFVGFSPSVVRASIMSLVGLSTLINGKRRDGLNSLCLAMTVILCLYPLCLFDVGFQMSCGSVFGILTLNPLFMRGCKRIHMPKKLAAPVCVSAAAQIGVTPCTILYFQSFSVYALLANIILLPVLTVTFIALFLTAVIVALIPPVAFLFKPSGILLWTIEAIAEGVTYLPGALILLYALPLILLCYPLLFVISDYFMLPKGKRFVMIGCALVFLAVCAVPSGVFRYDHSIIPLYGSGVNTFVSDTNGKYIIGSFEDCDSIDSQMKSLKIRKVQAVLLTDLTESSASELVRFARIYKPEIVYLPTGEHTGLRVLFAAGLQVAMSEDGIGNFTPQFGRKGFYGYAFDFGKGKALLLAGGQRIASLPDGWSDGYAIIRSRGYADGAVRKIFLTDYSSASESASDTEFSRATYGSFAFDYERGEVREII